jgi:hypothetical protein
MFPEAVRFLPIAIVVLVVFTGLPLIVGGSMGLRRSRTGVMQAISVSAIVTGSLLLLGMVLAIHIGGRAFGIVPLFVFLAAVFSFVVWLAALVDCATKEPGEGNDKIVWVIIIVFTQVIGAVLYLLVRWPQRIRETGR